MAEAKMNLAVERDPIAKGTYHRRLDDAFVALSQIEMKKISLEAKFVFHIFACEKVDKVMIGIQ